MSQPFNDQVAKAYYVTTAGRSHIASEAHYRRAAEGLRRRLKPWFPERRDARCLDLGCGCGELLFMLEREGYTRTTGVDLATDQIREAKRFVRGELVAGDLGEFLRGCPDAAFDFILAFNVLEHLSKGGVLAVLREIRRTLAPGGALVAMVPNAISPFGSLTRHWDITHEWAFTPNNFRQLAPLVGFSSDIEFRECGPSVHGVVSAVRFALWQGLRAVIATWFLIEVADTKGGIYTMDMLVRLRPETR